MLESFHYHLGCISHPWKKSCQKLWSNGQAKDSPCTFQRVGDIVHPQEAWFPRLGICSHAFSHGVNLTRYWKKCACHWQCRINSIWQMVAGSMLWLSNCPYTFNRSSLAGATTSGVPMGRTCSPSERSLKRGWDRSFKWKQDGGRTNYR